MSSDHHQASRCRGNAIHPPRDVHGCGASNPSLQVFLKFWMAKFACKLPCLSLKSPCGVQFLGKLRSFQC